eukprot:TRINITY_DN4391_c0_g1_i1.p2 TRINITY_DN4391_c0_g1~~TRINITY_DN4391_c0_g1_i1.p2  ORF type:complete len:51 (+),score=4.47 TRINITY_DN4391_c0_g1_i1:240-392(+)
MNQQAIMCKQGNMLMMNVERLATQMMLKKGLAIHNPWTRQVEVDQHCPSW